MRKKKYYLQPEDINKKTERLQSFIKNYEQATKKLSVDNKIFVGQYISARVELGDYIHFQFKKDTEAAHLAYCINKEFSEMDKNIYREGNKNYDCVNIETPWFNVFDMWYKLRKKYYKGEAFEQERKHLKQNWFGRTYTWPDEIDVETNVAPNYNPVYKWKSGWEYDVDPMDHRNLKSFMKARLEKIRNLKGTVLQEKIKQIKLQKEKEEFEKQQKIKAEQLKEKEKQLEKKKKLKNMQDKRYTDLKTVAKDPGVYVICEKKKILTKVKNKNNCLYIGESQVLSKRLSSYQDLDNKNNELVIKISKKLKKPVEEILRKLKDNVHVRTLRFKSMYKDNQRKEIESYLINRLKPLANSSNYNKYAERSFFPDKKEFQEYKEKAKDFFFTEKYEWGDSETLFNRRKKTWVKRNSRDGEEAEDINSEKAFKTWFKKFNDNEHFDMWKNDSTWSSEIVKEWRNS